MTLPLLRWAVVGCELFPQPSEAVAAWTGRYMLQEGLIYCYRAILQACFWYLNRSESPFRAKQVRLERRTLSTLRPFFPHHQCCIYDLHESSRNELAVWAYPLTRTSMFWNGFDLKRNLFHIQVHEIYRLQREGLLGCCINITFRRRLHRVVIFCVRQVRLVIRTTWRH